MKRMRTARLGVRLFNQLFRRQEQKWQRISQAEKLTYVKLPAALAA
jgi:hypothetical protein